MAGRTPAQVLHAVVLSAPPELNGQEDNMNRKERPTKEQVHRTLKAEQDVYLAYGVAPDGAPAKVSVRNYANDDPVYFPESGGWKSFAKIKRDLAAEIERKYPSIAFPYRRAGTIRLAERNEEDKMYLVYGGEYGP